MKILKKVILISIVILSTMIINLQYIPADNILKFENGNNLIWLMASGWIYIVFNKFILADKDRRLLVTSIMFGSIISICQTLGTLANNIWRNEEAKFNSNIIIFTILKFLVCWIIVAALFYVIITKLKENKKNLEIREYSFFSVNKRSFFFVFFILIIAYLPYYFNYYPGTTSFDTNYQLMQGLGIYDYTNHHPVLHTYIISNIVKTVHSITDSYTIAIGMCSLLQLIICALVFSYMILYMAKKGIKPIYRLLALLFFSLAPFIAQLNIAIWKDTPFSILVLLMLIPLIEIAENREKFFGNYVNIILVIILFTIIPFFKITGIYIISLTFPFVLIGNRRY